MLDVVSGYVFVVIGIAAMLYPLYEFLSFGINKYLGSVSGGDWKFNLPYANLYHKSNCDGSEWSRGLGLSVLLCIGVYSLIVWCIVLLPNTEVRRGITTYSQGLQEDALQVINVLYTIGTYATIPILVCVFLYGLHKLLKVVHTITKKLND